MNNPAREIGQVYLNGRFTAQAMTGVQRFASEIWAALPSVWPPGWPAPVLLKPGRRGGGVAGHLWEQAMLPGRSAGGVLVNLGNTGPLLAGRQLVVIHDAGVFATPEAYSAGFRLWYPRLQSLLIRGGARIATVSAFGRAELARQFRLPPDGIDVVSEGAEHILRAPADPGLLARHALVPGRFVLVVGSMAAHKNLRALGPAAAMLAARGMELVITGGFDAAVFQGGGALPRPARYIGRVGDDGLRALYENAACFLFPSRYEGFGLPAVEAMACGCPVVASHAEALRETCGDAALFCDPASPEAIAGTVAALLDDPAQAAWLRERGRRRAAGMTWPAAARRLVDSIARLGGA